MRLLRSSEYTACRASSVRLMVLQPGCHRSSPSHRRYCSASPAAALLAPRLLPQDAAALPVRLALLSLLREAGRPLPAVGVGTSAAGSGGGKSPSGSSRPLARLHSTQWWLTYTLPEASGMAAALLLCPRPLPAPPPLAGTAGRLRRPELLVAGWAPPGCSWGGRAAMPPSPTTTCVTLAASPGSCVRLPPLRSTLAFHSRARAEPNGTPEVGTNTLTPLKVPSAAAEDGCAGFGGSCRRWRLAGGNSALFSAGETSGRVCILSNEG